MASPWGHNGGVLGGLMAAKVVTTEHGLLLANFLLASVAAWSAWLSRRGLRQEREAIQGTTRPVIVDVPLGIYMTPSDRWLVTSTQCWG
jgi:hypothetical protein